MRLNPVKSFFFTIFLVLIIFAPIKVKAVSSGILSLSGNLVQNKVLQGSNADITFSLTIQADKISPLTSLPGQNVDMVIVLDRSGSMRGKKLQDAKQALLSLINSLRAQDRFALVTYSDNARIHSNLLPMTHYNRQMIISAINQTYAAGGTNLGAGLQQGLNLLANAPYHSNLYKPANPGKLILISDGLANKGITSLFALGNMASVAVEENFTISTIGVGLEFNEQLMSYIADQGAGNYYYLENPNAFAEVFKREFRQLKSAVVTAIEIKIPLSGEISLIRASGYPIRIENNFAIFNPGNLRSGQSRKFFLTLKVPTTKEKNFSLNPIQVGYLHDGNKYTTKLPDKFKITCVKNTIQNKQAVFSSIKKNEWAQKVLQDDFNMLKEEVAVDIKSGNKQRAMEKIQRYHSEKGIINTVVGSKAVEKNLDEEVGQLKDYVTETFDGKPDAVIMKQKKNSKELQYEGYKGRRSVK